MAVNTGGIFIPGNTNHTVARLESLPLKPHPDAGQRPALLPAQPECAPEFRSAAPVPPTIVVQNGTGGQNSAAAENRSTTPQTTTPQTTAPRSTKQEPPRQETPRPQSTTPQSTTPQPPIHVQGQRTPAPPRRPDEPVVREKPGVVAAVQRIVGASPDDMWGDRTSAAVQERIMKFQGENGLPVTGRYDPETAKRMRVHSNTETTDLANALDAVKNLRQYYRLAPVHTVTETVENKKEGEGADKVQPEASAPAPNPAAPTTPEPEPAAPNPAARPEASAVPPEAAEPAAPTPATEPEASNKTPPVASAAPPTVRGVGPVQTADGHGDVGVCTVPSAVSTFETKKPPAVKGGTDAGTTPKNPFITREAVLLPYIHNTKPPETRDLLARPDDPKPELRTMETIYSKPAWMNAAAELGATLKGAGGKMEDLPKKDEFAHGVTTDASAHSAASFVGMA